MLICSCWLMDRLICHVAYDLSSFFSYLDGLLNGWLMTLLSVSSYLFCLRFLEFRIKRWEFCIFFLSQTSLWFVGTVLCVCILSWNLGSSGHRSPTYLTNFYHSHFHMLEKKLECEINGSKHSVWLSDVGITRFWVFRLPDVELSTKGLLFSNSIQRVSYLVPFGHFWKSYDLWGGSFWSFNLYSTSLLHLPTTRQRTLKDCSFR